MKTFSLFLGAALFCGSVQAQQALTPEVLKELSGSFEHNTVNKALKNAVSGNSIKQLVINQENSATPDTHFSVSVNSKGITDQQKSGRCWMFTGAERAALQDDCKVPVGRDTVFACVSVLLRSARKEQPFFAGRNRHTREAVGRQDGGVAFP